MKDLKFILSFLLVVFLGIEAFSATNAKEYGAVFNFNHGQGFQNYLLGTKTLRDQVRDLKITYDFTKMGGATGTAALWFMADSGGSPQSKSSAIPANALITGCYFDVITAPVGTNASLAFDTGAHAVTGNADLLVATGAAAKFTVGSIQPCIVTGSAATAIKVGTADVVPQYSVGTAALTAGKINLHIQYVLSD